VGGARKGGGGRKGEKRGRRRERGGGGGGVILFFKFLKKTLGICFFWKISRRSCGGSSLDFVLRASQDIH